MLARAFSTGLATAAAVVAACILCRVFSAGMTWGFGILAFGLAPFAMAAGCAIRWRQFALAAPTLLALGTAGFAWWMWRAPYLDLEFSLAAKGLAWFLPGLIAIGALLAHRPSSTTNGQQPTTFLISLAAGFPLAAWTLREAEGPAGLFVPAAMLAVAAVLEAPTASVRVRRFALAQGAALLVAAGVAIRNDGPLLVLPTPMGPIRDGVDGYRVWEKWNETSRVLIIEAPGNPPLRSVFIDTAAQPPIPRLPRRPRGAPMPAFPEWAAAGQQHLAYRLGLPLDTVAIINAGGGFDVQAALSKGAKRVIAVIDNDALLDLLKQNDQERFSGKLYRWPEVEVVEKAPRRWMTRGERIRKFGVIQFSLADSWAAVPGAAGVTAAATLTLTKQHRSAGMFADVITASLLSPGSSVDSREAPLIALLRRWSNHLPHLTREESPAGADSLRTFSLGPKEALPDSATRLDFEGGDSLARPHISFSLPASGTGRIMGLAGRALLALAIFGAVVLLPTAAIALTRPRASMLSILAGGALGLAAGSIGIRAFTSFAEILPYASLPVFGAGVFAGFLLGERALKMHALLALLGAVLLAAPVPEDTPAVFLFALAAATGFALGVLLPRAQFSPARFVLGLGSGYAIAALACTFYPWAGVAAVPLLVIALVAEHRARLQGRDAPATEGAHRRDADATLGMRDAAP